VRRVHNLRPILGDHHARSVTGVLRARATVAGRARQRNACRRGTRRRPAGTAPTGCWCIHAPTARRATVSAFGTARGRRLRPRARCVPTTSVEPQSPRPCLDESAKRCTAEERHEQHSTAAGDPGVPA
jgi:hypothetical protein